MFIYVNVFGVGVCGYEIYIFFGIIVFDCIVDVYWGYVCDLLGDCIMMCIDWFDGDYDKEVWFYVFICMVMFVVLIEYLFFDNF